MRRRVSRAISTVAGKALSAAVRAVATGFVCGICTIVALKIMGVPLPSTHDVYQNLENITRLARILS